MCVFDSFIVFLFVYLLFLLLFVCNFLHLCLYFVRLFVYLDLRVQMTLRAVGCQFGPAFKNDSTNQGMNDNDDSNE